MTRKRCFKGFVLVTTLLTCNHFWYHIWMLFSTKCDRFETYDL